MKKIRLPRKQLTKKQALEKIELSKAMIELCTENIIFWELKKKKGLDSADLFILSVCHHNCVDDFIAQEKYTIQRHTELIH
jgi:hypothetical protein